MLDFEFVFTDYMNVPCVPWVSKMRNVLSSYQYKAIINLFHPCKQKTS